METAKTQALRATSPNSLKYDGPAGIVVFLVAVPLCLGIALGPGAPLFSGVIAGIAGGTGLGLLAGSELSVAGPTAGLTLIVLTAIRGIGSFEGFLAAVVLSGVLQFLFGTLRLGVVSPAEEGRKEFVPLTAATGTAK